MNLSSDALLLVFLLAANGTPIAAKKLLGDRFAWPLDGGARFIDGEPLFGRSKTVRGIALGIVAATLCAAVLGPAWYVGTVAGGAAMVGDVASSFTKRRLKRASSSRALGLDQVPEALLPALVCMPLLSLSLWDVALVTIAFFIGELALSKPLYKIHFRDRPY